MTNIKKWECTETVVELAREVSRVPRAVVRLVCRSVGVRVVNEDRLALLIAVFHLGTLLLTLRLANRFPGLLALRLA